LTQIIIKLLLNSSSPTREAVDKLFNKRRRRFKKKKKKRERRRNLLGEGAQVHLPFCFGRKNVEADEVGMQCNANG
jgi:hypothetical protein